jgi:fido (protein-threonine AMPylation protein)
MTNPSKNRLHDYEAGWLALLLNMGVADEQALREAETRVAQAAIDEMNERRERRRAVRNRRRGRSPDAE